jgi:hypothetical protein
MVTPFTGIYIDCSDTSGRFATGVNDAGGKFATCQQIANTIIFPTSKIEHLVKN